MHLGIDPGFRKLGFALIDDSMKVIDSGIIFQEKKGAKNIDERSNRFSRIYEIYNFFESYFENYDIKSLCIEKLYFTKYNQQNAEFVYSIRGSFIILSYKYDIKIKEISPVQLKKYITGNGKSSKNNMKIFTKKIFNLQNVPEYDDAADALGLAFVGSRLYKT